jgi:A118 family predicted phage portal protein
MQAVVNYLKGLGYSTIENSYYSEIEHWKKWYKGLVPSFHKYTQYNGIKKVHRQHKRLNMGKTIPEDWANLLLNEKVSITVDKNQEYLDEVLKRNKFWRRANELIELAFALGTGAFVEFRNDDEEIDIDYIRADLIYPIKTVNGDITECAFASETTTGKNKRVYLNIHTFDDNGDYIVQNKVFNRTGDTLKPIILSEDDPNYIVPEVETKSPVPRFQIIKPNIANNLRLGCPMGVSVFGNAIDQLQGCDLAYDSYCNEFRLGKKRIMVPISQAKMMMDDEGVTIPVFDTNDTEFYAFPGRDDDENKIQEIDMDIRADDHDKGINKFLSLLSYKCGMGTNRYRFENGGVKTATEVISEDSDLYKSMVKHEIILSDSLVSLVESIYAMSGMEIPEITIMFDDSIISDSDSQRASDRADVQQGIMNIWEYRKKWYGEDETKAKANTPDNEGITFPGEGNA